MVLEFYSYRKLFQREFKVILVFQVELKQVTKKMGKGKKYQWPAKTLYRYLDNDEHAQRFLEGRIWISSTPTFRASQGRPDPQENAYVFEWELSEDEATNGKTVIVKYDFPGGSSINQEISIEPGGKAGDRMGLRGLGADAYVLCLSQSPDLRSFGRYKISINEPETFGARLNMYFREIYERGQTDMRRMDYSGRNLTKMKNFDISDVIFLGEPKNRSEHEVRFYWRPDQLEELVPHEIYAPSVADLCSLEVIDR